MAERKNISNKLRFEVFKRDSFMCQYCGAKSPDVVLNVDHIKPVSKGGDNDLMNLITSCFECNSGKSDRELNDSAVIDVQHEQLKDLNERRAQLEMMISWRNELQDFDKEKERHLIDYISNTIDATLTDSGIQKVKSWVKKYDLQLLMDSTDKAYEQYAHKGNEEVFDMIQKIAHYTLNPTKEHIKKFYYIRGILRNRLEYWNDKMFFVLMNDAHQNDIDLDIIEELAKTSSHWTSFRESVSNLIEGEDDD